MIDKMLSFVSLFPLPMVALRVELVRKDIVEKFIKQGVPLTLWSDQDSPLGEEWWRRNGEKIRRYSPVALMDFPDAPTNWPSLY